MTRPPPGFGQPPQAMQSLSNAGPTHPPLAGAPPTSHPPPSFPPPGAHINPQVYRQNFGMSLIVKLNSLFSVHVFELSLE